MLVTITYCEHQDAPARLRGSIQRSVVDMIFDAVVEPPRTRRMEAFDQIAECAAVCMADQAGDVLDEYDPRPQTSDIGGDGL
jgi:hypothetical protein